MIKDGTDAESSLSHSGTPSGTVEWTKPMVLGAIRLWWTLLWSLALVKNHSVCTATTKPIVQSSVFCNHQAYCTTKCVLQPPNVSCHCCKENKHYFNWMFCVIHEVQPPLHILHIFGLLSTYATTCITCAVLIFTNTTCIVLCYM